MKNRINDKIVENMIDYSKENIPSILNRHEDNISISYSDLGDTIIEFKSDKIAISYGHIMDHMIENPFNNLMNFRIKDNSKYVYNYMKNQYQTYKDEGIRLIQLFDVTVMNFECGGAENDLYQYEQSEFNDLKLFEKPKCDGKYLDLDLRYCDYEHFRFKDKFELVKTSSSLMWACGTSYLNIASNYLKEKCNSNWNISDKILINLIRKNHLGVFFDAGHQLLKLKD